MSDKEDNIFEAKLIDWFTPAIVKSNSLENALGHVLVELNRKKNLIEGLIDNLCTQSKSDFDAVTDLRKSVRLFRNTLDVRVGILEAGRLGAWFRESIFETAGPFQTPSLKEPVFQRYPNQFFKAVREDIQKSWRSKKKLVSKHMGSEPCLWSILLEYNEQFDRISQIEVKSFGAIDLNSLPHELPEGVESPLLRQFLLNVSAELSKLRAELNSCYSILWTASSKLWRFQMERSNEDSFQRREHASREDFRSRRKKYSLSKTERERSAALRFMGFESMPTDSELRNKYLDLAKTFHPDRQGGSDEEFKQLSQAYQILNKY